MGDNLVLAPNDSDLKMRLEKAFQIRWSRAEFLPLSGYGGVADVTAGQLHDAVADRLCVAGRRVPPGSWRRVRLVLCEVRGIDPRAIRRESRLNGDLNLYRGG
jgi:hypothetical protein